MSGDSWALLFGFAATCVIAALVFWAWRAGEPGQHRSGEHRRRPEPPQRTTLVDREHKGSPPWGSDSWE